jgi:hypothetical protein
MKRNNPPKKVPLVQALFWIVGSMLVVSGGSYSLMRHYFHWQKKKASSPKFCIESIIQTGPQKEALKTVYLAELMGLSKDKPMSSLLFDTEEAKKRLLSSPVIKEAHVKIMNSSTVYVDYTVRQPLAWLYDFENVAIDEEGYLFPVSPFFSPKNLPEIYLGLEPFEKDSLDPNRPKAGWNTPVKSPLIEIAFSLLKLVEEPAFKDFIQIKRIDVSHADAPSYGQREIVLITEDEIPVQDHAREVRFLFPRVLRLTTKNYAQELGNYLNLRDKLLDEDSKKMIIPEGEITLVKHPERVIDFRIPRLAFMDGKK